MVLTVSLSLGITMYRYEMTAAHWKQVSISAFLRYEYYNPSIFRGLPAVVQQQAMRTPDAEETILDSILDLYYDHVPQQVLAVTLPLARDPAPSTGYQCQHVHCR